MQAHRILVVEDESILRTTLFRALSRIGYQVLTAATRTEAQTLAKSDAPLDLAFIDLRLPDGNGMDLMAELMLIYPKINVIIITGYGTIDLAVQATRKGAFHFVTKPFNVDEILSLAEKALLNEKSRSENSALDSALHKKYLFENIVGQSSEIINVLRIIEKVAESEATVLITGESGTGKELVAKAIHFNSRRAGKPFIPINCGAIPAELLESELFGHIKGAFTGAIANRTGRFELAEGGTLFLDEIGDMSPNLQVKLLRVLQERRFEPLGSTKTTSADVRVLAATNANLEKAVADGRFREDLYYRLNVIPITVPPLRERRSDIPTLFQHFLTHFNRNRDKKLAGISGEAMDFLLSYNWPGNIRELENLVERLTILKGEGLVDTEDLPAKYKQSEGASERSDFLANHMDSISESGMDFNSAVDNFENSLILKALEKTGWNRNQAAILLKLNRTTLVEKIKKKGLAPPDVSI
jgi:DNA-binding NtrC family response regulator